MGAYERVRSVFSDILGLENLVCCVEELDLLTSTANLGYMRLSISSVGDLSGNAYMSEASCDWEGYRHSGDGLDESMMIFLEVPQETTDKNPLSLGFRSKERMLGNKKIWCHVKYITLRVRESPENIWHICKFISKLLAANPDRSH